MSQGKRLWTHPAEDRSSYQGPSAPFAYTSAKPRGTAPDYAIKPIDRYWPRRAHHPDRVTFSDTSTRTSTSDRISDLVKSLQRSVSSHMGASGTKDSKRSPYQSGAGVAVTDALPAADKIVSQRSQTVKTSNHRTASKGNTATSGGTIIPRATENSRHSQKTTTEAAAADDNDHESQRFSLRGYRPEPLKSPSAQRVALQPPCAGIKLVKMKVGIDKRLTIIDEKSPAVLKYRTPHFRAMATVTVPPLHTGQRIQVGWIQVCTEMQFVNLYGDQGITSWEFPEIVTGKYRMISDADGKQYPWYGSKNEVQTLEGPTSAPNSVTVHMNDNFFPQVTWYIPHNDYPREPMLNYVYRRQKFFIFLAVKDLNTNVYQILKTVAWSMQLAIQVNPSNPLGKRATLIGPMEQETPIIFDDNNVVVLEKYAMNPPNANNSQVLVWRPNRGEPKVIVPPIQTTIDVVRYLQVTTDQTPKLKKLLQRIMAPVNS